MSVYKSKKSPFWQYDFVIEGRRYHGSTGQTGRRAAEAYERKRRGEIASGAPPADAGDMTIEHAAARWFAERGAIGADAPGTRKVLDTLIDCLGKRTRLRDIDGAKISASIARRRGMLVKKKPPANATVNRMLARLRSIMRRARRAWSATSVPDIAWDEFFLPEPKPAAREYTAAQVDAWRDACGPDAGFALDLMLTYGLRFGELFFAPADIDAIGMRLTIRGRKADDDLVVPLLPDHAVELARRAAVALAKDYPSVWFDDVGPFAYWALHWRIRSSGERTGLKMGRLIHGARHHAGTRMARVAGLAAARQLLGHASIVSTARYAHALEDDLRNGLDALSRNSPGRRAQQQQKSKKGEQ